MTAAARYFDPFYRSAAFSARLVGTLVNFEELLESAQLTIGVAIIGKRCTTVLYGALQDAANATQKQFRFILGDITSAGGRMNAGLVESFVDIDVA